MLWVKQRVRLMLWVKQGRRDKKKEKEKEREGVLGQGVRRR